MAQSQQPERGGDAEFVRRIVTDPNNVPDVMRLYGYLGASSEENHERLYLSPDLSNYVEVPASAILHRMAVPQDQDPHGAVMLWVRRDAALISKMAPAAQALAQYFAGAIQAAAGARAGGGAAPMAGPAPGTGRFCTLVDCTPLCTPQCPTHQPSCFVTCGSCFGTCIPACSPACPSPPWLGCTPACTPATCNPPICGQTPGAQCTQNIACVRSPVCTVAEPACQSAHHPVCSALCAAQGAAVAGMGMGAIGPALPLTALCTQVAPCATHQYTPCAPCPTHQYTPCAPCPTHQYTPCGPCVTQIGCPLPTTPCGTFGNLCGTFGNLCG